MSFLSGLKSFDAYPKIAEDFKVKTFGGAISQAETVDHLFVDISRGEKLKINFDVSFPHIPCSLLSVDAMDVSGSHQLDVSHHIQKRPIDKFGEVVGAEEKHELGHTLKEEHVKEYAAAVQRNATAAEGEGGAAAPASGTDASGRPLPTRPPPAVPKVDPTKVPGYCGPCYGAETQPNQCCNTCDQVRDVYRARGWALAALNTIEQCVAAGQTQDNLLAELERGDGCQMWGYLEVNKVAGNFHFAPGKSFQHAHMHIHDLAAFPAAKFNVSHTIKQISFGEPFPGIVNPLDDTEKMLGPEDGGGMYMYYVKVVPTTYESLSGDVLKTNQFSVTEHFRQVSPREGQGLPGVFIFWGQNTYLSPIVVKFTESRKSLAHFLTQLCAILGGVFTCAGMVDRLVYSSFRATQKKNQQGKLI